VATDLWLADHGVAATLGEAAGVDASAVRDQAVAAMPTSRFNTPEEVATLVALLASPRTANVTGSNYVIDGRTRQDDVMSDEAKRCADREEQRAEAVLARSLADGRSARSDCRLLDCESSLRAFGFAGLDLSLRSY
jgi:hypothetical protein